MIPWGNKRDKADWRLTCLTPSEGGGAGAGQDRGRGGATPPAWG